jgi:hypothetical protein
MKKLFTNKRKLLISLAVILLTVANSTFLAYGVLRFRRYQAKPVAVVFDTAVVEQQIDIKSADLKDIPSSEQGKKLGEGDYKFESLKKSKITTGDKAELVIAANEKSGGHFVLAFLGARSKPAPQQINPGWTLTTIADDPMWAPGACSSKPTFLLQGKYIFIDDGKTNPKDKYNSYIVFDMATSTYNYFGGNNFTAKQANNETIIKAVNENDKLVFYIDTPDPKGTHKTSDGLPIHVPGQAPSYIIRREVDPATMHYVDYSLPFSAPTGMPKYVVNAGFDSAVIRVTDTNPDNPLAYNGTVQNNAITLKPEKDEAGTFVDTYDTPLELRLADKLKNQLPLLYKQKIEADNKFKTNFRISELGSHDSLQFLSIIQRFDINDTPAIYDKKSGEVITLTNQKVLSQPSKYVELGVF